MIWRDQLPFVFTALWRHNVHSIYLLRSSKLRVWSGDDGTTRFPWTRTRERSTDFRCAKVHRKKLAQRRSRISQSLGGHELKLTLQARAYNRSSSEGAQRYFSCRSGARNHVTHCLQRLSARRRRADPV